MIKIIIYDTIYFVNLDTENRGNKMIRHNKLICPYCGGNLKYYDSVSRIVRTKNGATQWITIRRLRCPLCGSIHRELPEFLFPNKHYEAEVIRGVLEGIITQNTLGFEDYPCEIMMKRWRAQNLHLLL